MTFRGIAQLVEQWSPKPRAQGSSPCAPAIQESLENVEIQRIQGFFICLMIYSICKNIGQMYPFLPLIFGQLWTTFGQHSECVLPAILFYLQFHLA